MDDWMCSVRRLGLVLCGVLCLGASARLAWYVIDPLVLAQVSTVELVFALVSGVFPALLLVGWWMHRRMSLEAGADTGVAISVEHVNDPKTRFRAVSMTVAEHDPALRGPIPRAVSAQADSVPSGHVHAEPIQTDSLRAAAAEPVAGQSPPHRAGPPSTNDHSRTTGITRAPDTSGLPSAPGQSVPDSPAAGLSREPNRFNAVTEWLLLRQIDQLLVEAAGRDERESGVWVGGLEDDSAAGVMVQEADLPLADRFRPRLAGMVAGDVASNEAEVSMPAARDSQSRPEHRLRLDRGDRAVRHGPQGLAPAATP